MYTSSRYGGYEVSSQGDSRFSAFRAILPDGRSIEEHYQCDIKGYDPGGHNWRLGKGKAPLIKRDTWPEYLNLWRAWITAKPERLEILKAALKQAKTTVLSDRFASTPINQARALATLLNESMHYNPTP